MQVLKNLAASAAIVLAAALTPNVALAQDDVLGKSWDEIVAQAKSEGELTFYAWWGEEFWRNAAAKFEEANGIKVNVVMGDGAATIGKVLAEVPSATGTIDVMLVGGVELKLLLDANAMLGPPTHASPFGICTKLRAPIITHATQTAAIGVSNPSNNIKPPPNSPKAASA